MKAAPPRHEAPSPTPPVRGGAVPFDLARIRADFPILTRKIQGRRLVYLDSAASSQMPRAAIAAMVRHQEAGHANVHRGVHTLSHEATVAYDQVREQAARFLGARSPDEVILAHGTTSAINLVARSWGDTNVKAGDEIVVTALEHHSNFVPWQALATRTGAVFRVAPILPDGSLDLAALARLLSPRTRVVAVTHASNVLGTVVPVAEVAAMAHRVGAVVVVDGAQSAPHLPVDVAALGADFFACSGHKLYGPTGVGLLYGRHELLQAMPPYEFGGGMIERVTAETTTWAPAPARFEAGTPPIAPVVGLGAAIEWLSRFDRDAVLAHEQDVLTYALDRIAAVPGVTVLGHPPERIGVLSFVVDGVHPHDVGTVLDAEGIAVRAGHHCAQPLMQVLGVPATARASFGIYSTRDDVDALVAGLGRVRAILG